MYFFASNNNYVIQKYALSPEGMCYKFLYLIALGHPDSVLLIADALRHPQLVLVINDLSLTRPLIYPFSAC
jgi:hypothetical protein